MTLINLHRFALYIFNKYNAFRTFFLYYEVFTEAKEKYRGMFEIQKSETRQVQERLVSTLEHMQVPKCDRTRCPEE